MNYVFFDPLDTIFHPYPTYLLQVVVCVMGGHGNEWGGIDDCSLFCQLV